MDKLIQEHNEIIGQIEDLEKKLNSMSSVISAGFDKLSIDEAIAIYNEMEDSQIKFNIFLKLKKWRAAENGT